MENMRAFIVENILDVKKASASMQSSFHRITTSLAHKNEAIAWQCRIYSLGEARVMQTLSSA